MPTEVSKKRQNCARRGLKPGEEERERRHRYIHCESKCSPLIDITWKTRRHQSRSGSAQCKWLCTLGPHGGVGEDEGEPECVFTVEVEPEQPLPSLSDKTEGFV